MAGLHTLTMPSEIFLSQWTVRKQLFLKSFQKKKAGSDQCSSPCFSFVHALFSFRIAALDIQFVRIALHHSYKRVYFYTTNKLTGTVVQSCETKHLAWNKSIVSSVTYTDLPEKTPIKRSLALFISKMTLRVLFCCSLWFVFTIFLTFHGPLSMTIFFTVYCALKFRVQHTIPDIYHMKW